MTGKIGYRTKVLLYFILLAVLTFLLLFLTLPRRKHGPRIRVLQMSEEGQSQKEVPKEGNSNKVIIDKDEIEKGKIVLECEASVPITWTYLGYGKPSVEVENRRNFTDFSDTTTYTFFSSLTLLQLSEVSTGKYLCSEVRESENEGEISSSREGIFDFVQIFVTGQFLFLLQEDLTLHISPDEDVLIPCPVSNPAANVTLLMKGILVEDENLKGGFDPGSGFILKSAFLQEKVEPSSFFVCWDEKWRQKSGRVGLLLKKDSLVIPHPPEEFVIFNSTSSGEFSCKSRESVVLRFRKIQKLRKPDYSFNPSEEFGYSGSIRFDPSDLKEGSVISCLSSGGTLLHSWTISFHDSDTKEVTPFSYNKELDEFVCCGNSFHQPRFQLFSCFHPIECRVKYHACFNLSPADRNRKGLDHLCSSEPVQAMEKSQCLHYKPSYGPKLFQAQAVSGILQCSVGDDKEKELVYSFANVKGQDGVVISSLTKGNLRVPSNVDNFLFGVETIFVRSLRGGEGESLHKYRCKALKFYFSAGFLWQIVRQNGQLEYKVGKDIAEGPWLISDLELTESNFTRAGHIKKIYCFIPIWNSDTAFVHKHTFTNVTNS